MNSYEQVRRYIKPERKKADTLVSPVRRKGHGMARQQRAFERMKHERYQHPFYLGGFVTSEIIKRTSSRNLAS